MRVKALTTFGGQYAMFKGDTAEIPDGPVADILISGRYIVPVAEDKSEEPPAEEAPVEAEETEAVFKLINLDKMTKDQLIEFANTNNIEIDTKGKKADILTTIKTELGVPEEE